MLAWRVYRQQEWAGEVISVALLWGGGGETAQLTPREGKGTPELTLSACHNFTQLANETALCSSLVKCLIGTL